MAKKAGHYDRPFGILGVEKPALILADGGGARWYQRPFQL
jgi:hypothetical protein